MIKKIPTIYLLFFLILLASSFLYAKKLPILINIQHIDQEIKNNVIARLESIEQNFDSLSTEQAVIAWYQQAPIEIKQAIAPYGYFSPIIISKLKRSKDGWYAIFDINLNDPMLIKTVNITIIGEGKKNIELLKTVKSVFLKNGQILKTPAYEAYKNQLIMIANEQGYIKAEWFFSQIYLDEIKKTARINLILSTGKRYYFGPLLFRDENQIYSKEFLNRFNDFNCHPYFSTKALNDYQQKMTRSPYFKEVSIAPHLETSAQFIPVDIIVHSAPRQKYSLGLGYSTWSGPRLLAGVSLKQLTNTGHYLESQLKILSIVSALTVKYFIPGTRPLNEQWILGGDIQRFLPKNGTSSSASLSAAYNIQNNKWQTNFSMNYLLEQYKIKNYREETSGLLYPNLNISYVDSDNPLFPTWGYLVNFNLRGGAASLFSSTDFLQSEIHMKYINSIKDGTRFILRGDLGYTLVNNITDLPLSMRFFTGGANSIRGYKESSIGPGKNLIVGSIELQQLIQGNWYVSLFNDQGKVGDGFDAKWNTSVGIGIIYNAIIGPIKLYLARDISLKNKPYRVEFSFGPEF